ncbi:MAG: hypothetical protein LBQ94_02655 [Treponema sp.]|nr:hypothetical protein [Treponema sp.]
MLYITGYEESAGRFCDIIKLAVFLIRYGRDIGDICFYRYAKSHDIIN